MSTDELHEVLNEIAVEERGRIIRPRDRVNGRFKGYYPDNIVELYLAQ